MQGYRTEMFNLLRGADTGRPSVLKETYRDKRTDEHLWMKEIKARSETIESNQVQILKEIKAKSERIKKIESTQVRILQILTAMERSGLAQPHSEAAEGLNDMGIAAEIDAAGYNYGGANDDQDMLYRCLAKTTW